MAILNLSTLRRIHSIALAADLAEQRTVLMAGINKSFVAGLPRIDTPSGQLLSDLTIMNDTERLSDGVVPLMTWLSNAATFARSSNDVKTFRRILRRCARRYPVAYAPTLPEILPSPTTLPIGTSTPRSASVPAGKSNSRAFTRPHSLRANPQGLMFYVAASVLAGVLFASAGIIVAVVIILVAILIIAASLLSPKTGAVLKWLGPSAAKASAISLQIGASLVFSGAIAIAIDTAPQARFRDEDPSAVTSTSPTSPPPRHQFTQVGDKGDLEIPASAHKDPESTDDDAQPFFSRSIVRRFGFGIFALLFVLICAWLIWKRLAPRIRLRAPLRSTHEHFYARDVAADADSDLALRLTALHSLASSEHPLADYFLGTLVSDLRLPPELRQEAEKALANQKLRRDRSSG